MLTAEFSPKPASHVPATEARLPSSLPELPLLSHRIIDRVSSRPVSKAATRTEIIRALIGTYNAHLSQFFDSVKNSHLEVKRHIPAGGNSEQAISVKIGDDNVVRGLCEVILPSLAILCSALRQSCGDDSLRRDLGEGIDNLRRFQVFLIPRRSGLTTQDNPYSWSVISDQLTDLSQTILTFEEAEKQIARLFTSHSESEAPASKKQS